MSQPGQLINIVVGIHHQSHTGCIYLQQQVVALSNTSNYTLYKHVLHWSFEAKTNQHTYTFGTLFAYSESGPNKKIVGYIFWNPNVYKSEILIVLIIKQIPP